MQDSPLSDLNIGGGDIPDVLLRAVNDTYLKPTPLNCETGMPSDYSVSSCTLDVATASMVESAA